MGRQHVCARVILIGIDRFIDKNRLFLTLNIAGGLGYVHIDEMAKSCLYSNSDTIF